MNNQRPIVSKEDVYGLESMSQVLSYVERRLIEQGGTSIDDMGVCQYRGPLRRCCGVGFLIPDTEYSPDFEMLGVKQLLYHRDQPALTHIASLHPEADEIFDTIQGILHDAYLPTNSLPWEQHVTEVMQYIRSKFDIPEEAP